MDVSHPRAFTPTDKDWRAGLQRFHFVGDQSLAAWTAPGKAAACKSHSTGG
jgi:hypothetical protein